MKIRSIAAENLLSFDKFSIDFGEGDVIIIFGPNNVGKTNLFRILKLLKNIIREKISISDLEIYLHNKEMKSARIEIEVQFDDIDKEILAKFLKIFFKINAPDLIKACNSLKINIVDSIIEYFSSGSYIWECSQVRCYKPHFIIRLKTLEDDLETIKKYLENRGFSRFVPDLIDHSRILHELDRNVGIIEAINNLKNIITESINTLIELYEKSDRLYFSTLTDGKKNVSIKIKSNADDSVEIPIKGFIRDIEEYEDCFKRLTMDTTVLKAFIVLLALDKLLTNNMSICINKILDYSKENPWDEEIIEDLKQVIQFFGYDFNNVYKIKDISLNDVLLKIYENSLVFYEDYLPESGKVAFPNFMVQDILIGDHKEGVENKLVCSYLFYLKNNLNIRLRKRYLKIKEMFEYMFNGENLSFDVILTSKGPDVVVYSDEIEIPLSMAGLGVKKILEILTLMFGNDSKVVLLDSPFIQLYQKYQKRFSKIFKRFNEIDSQIFIILHSLHFVSNENISNTFRFYKPGKSTKYLRVGDIIKKLEEMLKIKVLDRTTKEILLSDAVILLSSALRDLPLLDLAEYENIPIDEYNIEIIRPQNTLSFEKYYALLQFASIPYVIIVRSWVLYNLYEKIEDNGKIIFKLMEKGRFNKLVEERLHFFKTRHPFWLTKKEFDNAIQTYLKIMESHREKLKVSGYETLLSEEDVIKYCIEPLREKLDPILREKLFIFTVPHDFIIMPDKLNTNNNHSGEYIIHNHIGYKRSVLKEFKRFFEYFVKFHNIH